MRNIGHLATEPDARKLGDFLYLRGIRNEVEPEPDGRWALWIIEDDQVAEAAQMLERFRANSTAPEFQVDTRKSAALRKEELEKTEEAARRQWGRERIFPQQIVVTLGLISVGLILASIAIYLVTGMGDNRAVIAPLLMSEHPGSGRFLPASRWLPEVMRGEIWRLFTPALLHSSFLHLLFNMLWLKDLGSLIETRVSSLYLLVLVVGTAIGSNLVQYWWGGPGFGGMSGVVYGLFGFIWVRGKLDPASGLFLDKQTVVLMLVWFFVCFFEFIPRVANGAHLGGLVIGALWGFISSRPRLGHRH
ncbi:rhomboid family intramembrane serine protease GlpG [Verrucomicrobiota bacterium]|nr:rhomboid family intramembrane serine protease GlpG [Verrucomicrobiota bacterium]